LYEWPEWEGSMFVSATTPAKLLHSKMSYHRALSSHELCSTSTKVTCLKHNLWNFEMQMIGLCSTNERTFKKRNCPVWRSINTQQLFQAMVPKSEYHQHHHITLPSGQLPSLKSTSGPDFADARPKANPLVRPLSHCYEEKQKSAIQFELSRKWRCGRFERTVNEKF